MMAMDMVTAHRLAHFIEWTHAKQRADDMRGRKAQRRELAEALYDPLAATCLGDLIYSVSRTGKFADRARPHSL